MKTILAVAPISMKERWGKGLDKAGSTLPPLGIAYIAAVLERNGYPVKICDCQALKMTEKDFIDYIRKEKPDIVGLSSVHLTEKICARISSKIKKEFPETRIIWGGPYATVEFKNILKKYKSVDIVVIGEGEITFLELIRALKASKDLKNIKGIVYRKKGRIRVNQPRPFIKDLDSIPFPARHLLPMKRYRSALNGYKRLPMTNMMTSRGCIFRCAFCYSKRIFGDAYRQRSPENVIEEIKYLKKEYGVREIDFWDDVWGLRKEWIERFCKLMIKENLEIIWACETRVDLVDAKILKLMKKAGCWNIFYGFESGVQELLDNVKKDITLEQSRKAAMFTKAAGIEIRGNFILALFGETPELAIKTIEFVKELDPDYARFNTLTVWPKTEMYRMAKKYGKIEKGYRSYIPGFVPKGYKNKQEVLWIRRLAYRKFYFRPSYIIKRIMKIRSLEDVKRHIWGLMTVITL